MAQVYFSNDTGKFVLPPPLEFQYSEKQTEGFCAIVERLFEFGIRNCKRPKGNLLEQHVWHYLHPAYDDHPELDQLFIPFHYGNINHRISFGPLIHMIASRDHRLDVAERAVRMGADLNARNDEGNTPLMHAAANANHAMVKKIIQLHKLGYGNCNLQDEFGEGHIHKNTAMHLLIGKGYRTASFHGSLHGHRLPYSCLELVKDLIDIHADVNIQNGKGNTPLHLACIRRDKEACRLLVENGAQTNIRNEEGKTPAELLHNTYEKSIEELKDEVGIFILDREKFESAESKANIEKLLKKSD